MSKYERPNVLRSTTVKKKGHCGNIYVTVSVQDDKTPREAISKMGKAGGCAAAFVEAIGRLMSRALSRGDNIEDLAEELDGIMCGQGKNSCPDCIAKAVLRLVETGHIKRHEEPDLKET